MHGGKPDYYYRSVRTDIWPLLPDRVGRVLELGCGIGATLRQMKAEGRCEFAIGIEPSEAAKTASDLDQIEHATVETALDAKLIAPVDLVLALDVLEHLIDPWTVVKRLTDVLKPGGAMIISVPNVRNQHLLRHLIRDGRWDYAESGIMDSTHLRWFTRRTAQEMLTGAGLVLEQTVLGPPLKPWKNKWLINKLTMGAPREFYADHIMIRARKPAHLAAPEGP